MTQLKLGRLPKAGTVRLHVVIPETVKDELERYVAEYSRLYEPADVLTLIPHMLEAFICSDRAFRRGRKKGGQTETIPARPQILQDESADATPAPPPDKTA